MLRAHLVEASLDGKPHQQLLVDTLEFIDTAQLVLVAYQQLDVVVSAGNQGAAFAAAFVPGGKIQQGSDKHLVVLNFGSTTSTETILLAVQGPSTPLPMATDFRPYSSWEGASHAVNVDIAAQQNGLKIDLIRHVSIMSFLAPVHFT